ncbi:hypothetical protein JMJ35_005073 [Cladonia borealis]|uniref:Uncharacterized protein n=1 Tax=Cladonia borealis TaxID=184061 RepID=A0AA39UB44_9LECA|nr:hypothetical protein JMJ35_005073 [Cladonia borealis]
MDDIVLNREVLPFPAELRNMIYRYLVCKTYLIYWPSCKEKSPTGPDTFLPLPKALVDFPIFQVSKTTRREALALLYAESTFRYWVDKTRKSYHYRDACPGKEILNLVQDIEIHVSVPNLLSDVPSLATTQKCEEIADKLNETSILRDSLLIRLNDCDAAVFDNKNLPLFRALAKLTKFKSVTVEVCGGAHQPKANENIPLAKARTMIQLGILSKITADCDYTKDLVQVAMEPILGPVVEEGDLECAQNVCYARYLKFYPQATHSPTPTPAETHVIAHDETRFAEGIGGFTSGLLNFIDRTYGWNGHEATRAAPLTEEGQ